MTGNHPGAGTAGAPEAATGLRDVVPGVHVPPGPARSVAIETARGVVLVDAGPGGAETDATIAWLRAFCDRPVSHIVYSHGHRGRNEGVDRWRASARGRGEPAPVVVAHAGVAARHRRYRETEGLQRHLDRLARGDASAPPAAAPVPPELAFETRMMIDGGDRVVELLAAPSRTDDALAVWLPADRFLYAGVTAGSGIPNVGDPLRTLRDPMRWADTLERLHALGPATVLGESGTPARGAAEVDGMLLVPVAGLRWLRAAVVARMNAGMAVDEIVDDVVPPEAIFGHPSMRPVNGDAAYAIREIWRTENGWWDRNPTTLHPAAPEDVAADLRDAVGADADDAGAVVARARELAASGEHQLALHVVDLVALQPAGASGVGEALELKARLLEARADAVAPVVSRNVYRGCAQALRARIRASGCAADPTDPPAAD